jgi:heme-degrading monooxygenase HmoA
MDSAHVGEGQSNRLGGGQRGGADRVFLVTLAVNQTDYPVLEVAILNVKDGQVEAFKASFMAARPIIAAAPGFGGLELRRCIEHDHQFLLLVKWDSVASHEVGFRNSPGYEEWRKTLHHFCEPFPSVEHYVVEL